MKALFSASKHSTNVASWSRSMVWSHIYGAVPRGKRTWQAPGGSPKPSASEPSRVAVDWFTPAVPPPNAKLLSPPVHNPPTPRLWDPTLRLSLQLSGGERSRGSVEEKSSLARVALKLINAGKLCPDPSGPGVPEVSPTPRSPRKKKTSLRPALVLPPLHCLETEPGASPRPGKSTWGPGVLQS